MIDAKELYINCWYNIKNPLDTDFIPTKFTLWTEAIDFEGYGEPIPLTEEILLASGFEDMKTDFCYSYKKEQIEIEVVDSVFMARLRWEEQGASLWLCNLSTLHQLMNLYYSLTGKEIEYKPAK